MKTDGTAKAPLVKTRDVVKDADEVEWSGAFANEANKPFLIAPTVEMYGTFCKNEHRHPKPPSTHYSILKVLGTGCGTFGKDDIYSLTADSYDEWSFYNDNADKMGSTRMALESYK